MLQDLLRELKELAPNAPDDKLRLILNAAFALLSKESVSLGLPDFPVDSLPLAAIMLEQNPKLSVYNILYRLYPYKVFLKDSVSQLESMLSTIKIPLEEPAETAYDLRTSGPVVSKNNYVETSYQSKLTNEILQTAIVSDFCLIGPAGCGKTVSVTKVARKLGKGIETIILYQDMTSRDLLQQRTTLENGDTIWKFSPLVTAALEGKIAVLDGLHRIHPSTLSVLHRLVKDRELQLHDGKRLIRSDRYDAIKEELKKTDEMLQWGVLKIHPNFSIFALAEPPTAGSSKSWITPEVLSLFLFHEMRTLRKDEEMHIITSLVSCCVFLLRSYRFKHYVGFVCF